MTERCPANGCDREVQTRGMCHTHYTRWRLTGSPQYDVPIRPAKNKKQTDVCVVEGCDRAPRAKNLCMPHYQRVINGWDMAPPVRKRNEAGSGTRTPRGMLIPVNGKRRLRHRLVMEQHLGRALFPDERISHINGDNFDDRLENLELRSCASPASQRVGDLVAWAWLILDRYEGEGND